jgi:hypothetical protein
MSKYGGDNQQHGTDVAVAEGVRQVAVAAASTQAAVIAAEITFYRTAKASGLANNVSVANYVFALRQLGTGGS